MKALHYRNSADFIFEVGVGVGIENVNGLSAWIIMILEHWGIIIALQSGFSNLDLELTRYFFRQFYSARLLYT